MRRFTVLQRLQFQSFYVAPFLKIISRSRMSECDALRAHPKYYFVPTLYLRWPRKFKIYSMS